MPRDRLLNRLAAGRQRPLTLITAPAGYGKSTLASRWTQACEMPCAWVSLGGEDNDLHPFLAYLLAAIGSLFPNNPLTTEALLNAEQLPPVKVLVHNLLNDLQGTRAPFILVLDDYHHIKDPKIHELIAGLMAYPAQSLRLMLLTRTEPPLAMAGMRARGLLTEIRGADLRLPPNEVSTFMEQMLNAPVDEATAAILEKKTEGWPAGLRLAGLYLQGQRDFKLKAEELGGSSTYIAEYLFTEVMRRQRPEIVRYMLETSVLNRFCAPLCHHMCQDDAGHHPQKPDLRADAFTQYLRDANLFIIPLDDEGTWFRFHHLFQDFLKGLLNRQYDDHQISALHRVAAKWFADNNLMEEALEHLLIAGDTPQATQLVIDKRHALLNNSQFNRLSQWLNLLPPEALLNNPFLVTTQALLGFDLGKNIDIFSFTEKAKEILGNNPSTLETSSALTGEVRLLQGVVNMVKDHADPALSLCQEAFPLIPEHAGMVRSVCLFVMSVCHQMMGNTGQAVAMMRKALANQKESTGTYSRMHITLCYIHYLDAQLENAKEAARNSLRITRGHPFYHAKAYARYFLGVALYKQNSLEAARVELQQVLDLRYTANQTYVTEAGLIISCINLSLGEEEMAMNVLEDINGYCQENNHARSQDVLRAFAVEFTLIRGNVKDACAMARTINFEVRPPRWFPYIPQLTYIKCLMAEGTDEGLKEAESRLTSLNRRMLSIHRTNIRIDILLLLAILYHGQNREAEALEFLQAALELAEPGRWIRSFLDAGLYVKAMLADHVNYKPGQTFATDVLRACQKEEKNQATLYKQSLATRKPDKDGLTKREKDVLQLLADGLSNKEIAATLNVAQLTVKTHLQNIYRKLNATNRIDALKKSRMINRVS